MPLGVGAPVFVVLEQLDVELVQSAGGLDVDRVVLDLGDRGDAGEGQEKTELIGKVGVGTGKGLTAGQLARVWRTKSSCRSLVFGGFTDPNHDAALRIGSESSEAADHSRNRH